jgi:hypothetical protein
VLPIAFCELVCSAMATKSAQLRVLEQPLVLDVIFDFAGFDQWLFFGGVSKAWAAMYHPRS